MKITFEAATLPDLIHQIAEFTNDVAAVQTAPLDEKPPLGPVSEKLIAMQQRLHPPEKEAKPVEKPKSKGGRPKGYKVAKKANGTAPKAKPTPKVVEPEIVPVQEEVSFEDLELPEPEPEALTPVQLAAIRVKTTQELQAAYANGKDKQVLALLKEHGRGAKSFRELHIEDFVPIRKAIDKGALA